MFTSPDIVLRQLSSEGWTVAELHHIDAGVMTDTYHMTTAHRKYCVRCYPSFRSWLAKVEFDLLIDFQKHGVKAPIPVATSRDNADVCYLIYEWAEGVTLRQFYDEHTDSYDYTNLCNEIIENYRQLCSIPSRKFGRVAKGRQYQHSTWCRFLKWEIEHSRKHFLHCREQRYAHICDGLYEYSEKIPEPPSTLVWSDFSLDNIIVTPEGSLVAFIDFEGIMSGDPIVGISYLNSQEPDHPLTQKLVSLYNPGGDATTAQLIDFYSVFRYVRLAIYKDLATPNGSERESIDHFLPYVHTVDEQFNKPYGKLKSFKRFLYYMWKKIIILGVTIVLALYAINKVCSLYEPTIKNSYVEVKADIEGVNFVEDLPVWFSIRKDTLITYKILDDTDVRLLSTCIAASDSTTKQATITSFRQAINQLAYKSNTEFPNTHYLIILTLCLVYLGCTARTIYDYVGWECFKGGQDMDTWWPWYVFRPFIGVPITTFLLVACRTSMFSSLFTSRDLNTYLVISFLAGFAMMEFVTMLRRSSQALFGDSGKK